MNDYKVKQVKELSIEVAHLTHEVLETLKVDRTIFISGTPLTGELRRRSMDLTRALSEMRKSS